MKYLSEPEYWLRGAVDGVPVLLQGVAHALLQVRAEMNRCLEDLPENKLWLRPAGVAAPGFHVRHIPGVIDRLFTYARGEALSAEQMEELGQEGLAGSESRADLLRRLDERVDAALQQLRHTDPARLTEIRHVGRKRIPTTMNGLFVHAAEHSMRHAGQLLVTVRLL